MSTVRPGLALQTGEYQTEANAYLQGRLRLFFGIAFGVAVALWVVGVTLLSQMPGYDRDLFWSPERMVHNAALLVTGGALLLLRRRHTFTGRQLAVFDALGLYVAVGSCLAIYWAVYEIGPITMPAIVSVFVVARAVIVPCTGLGTFLLSLPAPLGILAIQLVKGTIYVQPYVEVMDGHFPQYVAWTQMHMFAAIVVASAAAHVNFGLRRQVQKAHQLGQYKLEEKIGEGTMGEVYKATHSMLRRPTAVKLLRPEITGEETIQRFEREVRQAARLTHPNTVLIYDYGRTPENFFYYAMEYLDGEDLDVIVKRTGPMPPSRAIHALTQACYGLAEAHDKGLVHRDIKASNLVLCAYAGGLDVVKVVDFGLVKEVGAAGEDAQLTKLGEICGTPESLAPEVLSGQPASAQSDLYSLGTVGYFLVTGKPAFDATTVAEFVGAHLHQEPIPPTDRNPAVPDDLEAVLLRCLAKDPAERPQGMTALAAELARCRDAGTWTQDAAASWWTQS
ncbi:MAG: serine/threonine-protein kinase [Planctomycetota bacterium]|jgi:serine/threonine-protein kinase